MVVFVGDGIVEDVRRYVLKDRDIALEEEDGEDVTAELVVVGEYNGGEGTELATSSVTRCFKMLLGKDRRCCCC